MAMLHDQLALAPPLGADTHRARRRATALVADLAASLVLMAVAAMLGRAVVGGNRFAALFSGAPSMRFASAACFAAIAAALLLAGRERRQLARSLAATVICAAASFVAIFLLDVQAGGGPLPVAVPPPSVAFGFVLAGSGVLLRCVAGFPAWARHAVRACGAAAAFLVVQAVLDQQRTGTPPFTALAPAAAVLFTLLAIALLAAAAGSAPRGELDPLDRAGGWGTVLLAASIFFGWSHLEGEFWRQRQADTLAARDNVAAGVTARLMLHANALARLAQRWDLYGGMTQAQFAREAEMFLDDRPVVQGLVFAGPDFVVRWHVPRGRIGSLVGVKLPSSPQREAVFRAAAAARAPRLTPAMHLHTGGSGVVYVMPVFAGNSLRGYVGASMELQDLVKVGAGAVLRDHEVAVRDADGTLLAGDARDRAAGAWSLGESATIDALGQRWTVAVWPRQASLARLRSGVADLMFLAGLLGVAAVAAAFAQARRSAISNLAARRLSQRLTTTLESITDAFFTIGRDMKVAYVNPEAERLLQRRREDLIGRDIWAEFPRAAGTQFELSYRRALADNCTVAFEEFYAPLARWFAVKAYPSPEGLAVYFQDVTQRHHAQEALRESERELRALAESMPQIVWMADADGATTYCNQRWLDYSGFSAQETYGMGWARSVHPDDVDAAVRTWNEARARGGNAELECRLRAHDGTYRWMLVRAVPHRDRDGQVVKWMGTCTDVDAIKQSADAVRASEQRFQLLAKATNDGIWEADLATGAVWWSEGFEALFGVHDRTGASLERSIARIHPEDREAATTTLQEAIAGGAPTWSSEYRFMRADGTFAHVLSRGSIIRDAQGRAVRLVGSMSDISDRIGLEEQLRQSQRLEAVGHLTGGLAHDFNNLLTVVLGNAETLTEALAHDASLRPLAEMILAAAERGADLTQRLLAFGRQQALEPVAVDIRRQLAQLEPLLRRTLGEHIEIARPDDENAWHVLVDPAQFDSALLNLCLNARDAMPYGGRLTIESRNLTLGADDAARHGGVRAGDYVAIAVTDTGCGIRPEHMGRLFEPFFTTKEIGKGTGLGLPMVYGFIRQSGGHVEVQSKVNEGTTVTLYLPRAPQAQAQPGERPRAQALTGREAILLVEDDFYVRTYARDQLRSLGYEVVDVASGPEAIEALRTGRHFDLLLTDVVMPQMSGPELAVHAQALRPGLKVLYTSGYTEDALTQGGGFGSGVRLLAKPYLRDELARRVREALLQA
jgi:PAS domain S-box-containing protein